MNRTRRTSRLNRNRQPLRGKDRLSAARRSWNMSRIRSKDTTPEKAVRSILHRLGYRFRLHVRIPVAPSSYPSPPLGEKVSGGRLRVTAGKQISVALVGTPRCGVRTAQRAVPTRSVCPDILLPKYRLAIFVHGCFWHRHSGCKNCTTPTARRDWWLAKLNGNAARDKLHQRALRKLGWCTLVIWECETEQLEKLDRLRQRLARVLSPSPPRSGRGPG